MVIDRKSAIPSVSQRLSNFCWGRKGLTSPAQEDVNSHSSYTLRWLWSIRQNGARDRPFRSWESQISPEQEGSTVCRSLWSDAMMRFCLMPLVSPKMPSKIHCLNTRSRLRVSKPPKTGSENLAVSLCPSCYLKRPLFRLHRLFFGRFTR